MSDNVKVSLFPGGLTVKQLKEAIKNWPETNEDGNPTEVWIETGWCMSSVVVEITPLNKRGNLADVILSSSAFDKPS